MKSNHFFFFFGILGVSWFIIENNVRSTQMKAFLSNSHCFWCSVDVPPLSLLLQNFIKLYLGIMTEG